MSSTIGPRLRRLLPWIVSASALGYVFGYATDWRALIAATREANLPLFIAFTAIDKLIFFLWWGILQSMAIRRFVTPVPTREVIAVRGGAELVRTANGPAGDAAFLYGVLRITGGSVAAVLAAFGLPVVCHFAVLLIQASLALLFLEGGAAANRDVVALVVGGWSIAGGVGVMVRLGLWKRLLASDRFGSWLRGVTPRAVLPFLFWFALFAAFDVWIQGLASRAFGVAIDWSALAARIPILYLALSLPSLGNFGTREIAWAASFSDFAPRDVLIAYAFATNTLFFLFHVAIGAAFLPRALALVTGMRQARREGAKLPEPLLRDASDP